MSCPGCAGAMTARRVMTLEQAETEFPPLAEAAHERHVPHQSWTLYECDHCDCGCKRFVPLPAGTLEQPGATGAL